VRQNHKQDDQGDYGADQKAIHQLSGIGKATLI
jgi:hypothetical protein